MTLLIILFIFMFAIQTICFVLCTIFQYQNLDFMVNAEKEVRKYREWQKYVINEKRNIEREKSANYE